VQATPLPIPFRLRAGDPALTAEFRLQMSSLPNVELQSIPNIVDFFEGRTDVDGLVHGAEIGSAWTLLYPDYSVVTPWKPAPRLPLAYGLHRDSDDLLEYLDHWITRRKLSGGSTSFTTTGSSASGPRSRNGDAGA